ncbi:hypothetical protein [Nocardioides sp. LS1]|nr:hypothetical protein [Nocardioides sp. LS1]
MLASPALLEGSGLGGPSVGPNLHVIPSYFISGVYVPTCWEPWRRTTC